MGKLNKYGVNTVTSPLRWIIATGLCFFIAAGRIDILNAWIYFIVYAVGGIIGTAAAYKKSPNLLNERGRIKGGTKAWDKYLVLSYFFLALIVVPIVSGLDVKFGWSALPFSLLYIGILLYIISLFFSFWPMFYNPHFETTVRIQKDRGHKVVDKGPYSIVRHPGYIGMITGALALGFALGSAYGFIPVILMVLLVVIRTYFEDKTLKNELDGYKDYSERVRYRLIPFIW